ncbi:MAG TPA: hypothetical protein VFG79_11950 [Solirubrobacter sp.]|nr:hypothetical protein [Solirubrobacter sp.]
MSHWLKAIGHARGPLPDAWIEERPASLRRTGFPRRPRMTAGDRLIYYASVWRAVFAAVEVVAEPQQTGKPGTDRWPWTVAVEPLVAIPLLDRAPPVEAIGVAARSMSQQSHIRLTAEQYARAIDVMTSVAA